MGGWEGESVVVVVGRCEVRGEVRVVVDVSSWILGRDEVDILE